MSTPAPSTPFTRNVYRDFALFGLAAISVGIAASLTLAAAILLIAPPPSHHADGPRAFKTRVVSVTPAALPHHIQRVA